MAVRTDFTIDWEVSPRIITVDAPSVEVTCQDLYDTLRSLEAETSAMDDASIVKAAGKEELGGGTSVGLTVTLQNALLGFAARSGPDYVQCSVSGGNVVAIDGVGAYFTTPVNPTAFTQVVITASSSATSSNIAAIEYSSFGGGVTYDAVNGYSGTGYVNGHAIGTPATPSSNIIDSGMIAYTRGFDTGFIRGDLTLDGTVSITGFTFIGEGGERTNIHIEDSAVAQDLTFYDAHVTGILDGNSRLSECLITDLNYVNGYVERCILSPGTITLGGTATAHFLGCWSGVPGTGTPTIDLAGSGQPLAIRGYNGGIKLINKTGPEPVSIDLASGQIKLDMDTVTNGTIVCRGVGKLVDADSGDYIAGGTYGDLTIINELVCTPCIADGVWTYERP